MFLAWIEIKMPAIDEEPFQGSWEELFIKNIDDSDSVDYSLESRIIMAGKFKEDLHFIYFSQIKGR